MTTSAKIVVLNPGSATIKWQCYPALDSSQPIASGQGDIAELEAELTKITAEVAAYSYVVRFVHGGDLFCQPVVISDKNFKFLQGLSDWAPLHNHNSLLCVQHLLQRCEDCKIVAVFDTHFFRDLPPAAKTYGLPDWLTQKYKLRRYGFHGFAHQAMCDTWTTHNGKNRSYALVTMQLGSGCSMAAIKDGQVIDTTMGFTPNEGLLMSTRSGDIDACLVTWLQKREGWTPEETERVLNKDSGWFGVSAQSKDMAELLDSHSDKAQLAVDIFCHRVRKTLGAYYVLLGGLDGIVIGGGIGEHAVTLRRRLLENLNHLGIDIDDKLNHNPGRFGVISSPQSRVHCLVAAENEMLMMLHEAVPLLK